MPRLQINEKLRVRQYIISDPPTIYCTEYYSSIKENSSADWQQQVKQTPTNLHNLDLQSNRQHSNTMTIRTLPLIDNYNPYYPDPDFGFDPIGTFKSTTSIIYTSTKTSPKMLQISNLINTILISYSIPNYPLPLWINSAWCFFPELTCLS